MRLAAFMKEAALDFHFCRKLRAICLRSRLHRIDIRPTIEFVDYCVLFKVPCAGEMFNHFDHMGYFFLANRIGNIAARERF